MRSQPSSATGKAGGRSDVHGLAPARGVYCRAMLFWTPLCCPRSTVICAIYSSALLVLSACTGSRPIVTDGSRTVLRDTTSRSLPDTLLPPEGITPNPLDDELERRNDPSLLAERLSRLDAMIQSAPTDSAHRLRTEYDSLLEEFTGEARSVATGSDGLYNPARQSLGDRGGTSPVDSFLAVRDGAEGLGSKSSPMVARSRERLGVRNGAGASPPATRASRRVPETRSGAVSTVSRRDATAENGSRLRASVTLRRVSSRRETQRRDAVVSGRDTDGADGAKEYIEGLASASAGRYDDATVQLPRAIESGDLSERHVGRAQRVYGQSLEATGEAARAAEQYRRAARRGGDNGDGAYIEQCRALAKSGERSRARRMLIDFIRRNPNSRQIVRARTLLQTM